MIIRDFGHVKEQARFKCDAPVFSELSKYIYIEQLAHQQQIRFATLLLQTWGTLKRAHYKAKTREIIWVSMFRRCVDVELVKSGNLKGAHFVLSRGRPSD